MKRPSPTIARPSGGVRTPSQLTSCAATRGTVPKTTTGPSPTTMRPYGRIRASPWPIHAGVLLMAAGRTFGKAIKDCTEAIEIDRESAAAYDGRGQVWSDKEDYDKALADSDEAIRRAPDQVAYYLQPRLRVDRQEGVRQGAR